MSVSEGLILLSVVVAFVVLMYIVLRGWEESDDGYF